MSRSYADPIDVRRAPLDARRELPADGPVGDPVGDPLEESPGQFLWRGRVYVVREVIAHWIESSAWWGGSRQSLEGAIPMHENEVWRVEAQSGQSGCPGVYDLRRDLAADRWVLSRAMD